MSEEKAFKITMLGATGVGKTSILTVMRKAMDKAVSESSLNLYPGKPDDEGLAEQVALGAFQSYERKLSELIDTKNFTAEGGLDGNNQNTEFYFYLKNFSSDSNSAKLLLEFQDYPGGWILPGDPQNSTVVDYLKNSPVIIIAIDTPALIERGGQYNERINMSYDIANILRKAFEADNNESIQNRMVIFAPVKCEKYFQANQAEAINTAIKQKYQMLLDNLKREKHHVAAVIIPIQTVGGVTFSYIDRRRKNTGEIPPFWYQQISNPKWETVNAEQPLRFILAFILRNYLQEKRKKRGFLQFIYKLLDVDKELEEAVKTFAKSSADLNGKHGIELIQGDTLLTIN